MTRHAQLLPILLVVGTSCVGTDVGNPPDDRRVTATLEFATYVSESEAPGGLVVQGDVEIEAVWMNVTELFVTPADDCRRPAARSIPGPFVVNLLDGEVYPSAPVLADEAGEICQIELLFGPASELPATAPDELLGAAFWAQSTRPEGPVTIEIRKERRSAYDAVDFVIDGDAGTSLRFINAFDPSDWFRDIPENGNAEIRDEVNESDAAQFWNGVRRGSRVVPDRNADRRVDRDEFDSAVALPGSP